MIDAFELLRGLQKKYRTQTEMADALGMKQASVSRIMSAKRGKEMRADTYAAILNLAREHGIIGESIETKKLKSPEGMIPQIDAMAGLGDGGLMTIEVSSSNGFTYSKESVRGHWLMPDHMLARIGTTAKYIAAFPTRGDSMEPTIQNGDVVFVDTRHRVPSPPDIYALEDQFGGVIIKRLQVISEPGDERVRVLVSSDNPLHRHMELDLDQIVIIGRKIGRFTL